jgi:hypothetical protein
MNGEPLYEPGDFVLAALVSSFYLPNHAQSLQELLLRGYMLSDPPSVLVLGSIGGALYATLPALGQ